MRYLISVLIMIFSFAECSDENSTAFLQKKEGGKRTLYVQKEMQTARRDAL